MLAGETQHQILHNEFDIDNAASVMFEPEFRIAVRGMGIEHFLAHGDDFFLQLGQIAWLAEDFATDSLETLADGRVTRTEAGAAKRLMLPGPGFVELVFAEGIDRNGKQAGVAVRAQAEIGFKNDTG